MKIILKGIIRFINMNHHIMYLILLFLSCKTQDERNFDTFNCKIVKEQVEIISIDTIGNRNVIKFKGNGFNGITTTPFFTLKCIADYRLEDVKVGEKYHFILKNDCLNGRLSPQDYIDIFQTDTLKISHPDLYFDVINLDGLILNISNNYNLDSLKAQKSQFSNENRIDSLFNLNQ